MDDADLYGAAFAAGSGPGGEAAGLYREIRTEAYGEDVGQTGWMTPAEQDEFASWLELTDGARVVDVACGAGRATLRCAREVGCEIHGIDLDPRAIEAARALAAERGLSERATFEGRDATEPLPFGAGALDAVLCIDAIPHLPGRERLLRGWARVLEPGGRVLFTDPVVVTGPVTDEEIALRSAPGSYVFVPPGSNERAIEAAGLELLHRADRTEQMEVVSRRWERARRSREKALRGIEGDATYEELQRYNAVAGRLAREGRMSRFAYLAAKPETPDD